MSGRAAATAVAVFALLPVAGAQAALAPSEAPVLLSPATPSGIALAWTPGDAVVSLDGGGGNGRGNGNGNGNGNGRGRGNGGGDEVVPVEQSVLRAPGPCAAPLGPSVVVATLPDAGTATFTDVVAEGTYCYSIRATAADLAAASPGLTVVVTAPAPALGLPPAIELPPAAPVLVAPAVLPIAPVRGLDLLAPSRPSGLTVVVPRVRTASARIDVRVRWINPTTSDLDHVMLVANARRAPRDAGDGTVVFRGSAASCTLSLRAGEKRFLALFAVDRAGNLSPAARQVVSLAALVSLRPLSGSVLHTAPLLTWKPRAGAAYYNLQVFHDGKRVLVAWPTRASYSLTGLPLRQGTYVWFVWPALGARSAAPRFGTMIGRATFRYLQG